MTSLELRVPPLLVVLIVAALMAAIAHLSYSTAILIPWRLAIVSTCVVLGALVATAGVVTFRKHQTTVDPLDPAKTQSLVTTGIYRISRNPMYLGFLLALVGWGAFLSNLAALLLLPAFVLYLNRFQIRPEERALSAKFGAAFDAYAASVRRWL